MECTGQHEQVISADFVETGFMKRLVVYQAPGLVYDDECKDSPASLSTPSIGIGGGAAHMAAISWWFLALGLSEC